jgi:multidrug resistance efflux pump
VNQPDAVAMAEAAAAPKPVAPEAPPKPPANPARRVFLIAIAMLLGVIGYKVIADRLTPYTSQAAVDAPLAQIAAQVAGQVVRLDVIDNARVKKGDLLFEIDREPFEIAVRTAQANLEAAVQAATVSELDISYASADLDKQRIDHSTSVELGTIVLDLAQKKAVSETSAIRARSDMKVTSANVTRAEVELQRARERLGKPGDDNAKVKQAMAALAQAQLDLRNTRVLAPADGVITNLQLRPGQYVAKGSPLLSFIATGPRWVNAAMRENQLGNIDPGDRVLVTFDEQPGTIFKGRVDSVGWGVAQGGDTPNGQLPDISAPNGWLREPQRFPVRVVIDPVDKDDEQPPNRSGAQANVVVLTGNAWLFNPLAQIWIRAVAWLSYLR